MFTSFFMATQNSLLSSQPELSVSIACDCRGKESTSVRSVMFGSHSAYILSLSLETLVEPASGEIVLSCRIKQKDDSHLIIIEANSSITF